MVVIVTIIVIFQVKKLMEDSSPGLIAYQFEDKLIYRDEISLGAMILVYFNGLLSIPYVLECYFAYLNEFQKYWMSGGTKRLTPDSDSEESTRIAQ